MSSSLSQVRRGGMRLNAAEVEDDCCKYKNKTKVNMNDSKGDCSCHNQQSYCCNRLTCYRNNNNNSNSSSNKRSSNLFSPSKVLPLFIKLAILLLATPMIDAGILKRSVAETNTAFNINSTINNTAGEQVEITTANTPISIETKVTTTATVTTLNNSTPSTIVKESDFTTSTTTHLANAQTVVENTQSNHTNLTDTEASIVNEPHTTTVEANLNSAIALNATQDVNNEINHHAVAGGGENIATEIRVEPDFIKPKFDYTETLLDGNLEENIRNSVKNEIEFEHDIGAAVIEHLQEVTDPEERQKLSEEILAIQTAQQLSNTRANASEVADVLTADTSNKPAAAPLQQHSSRIESTATTAKDLSIYFPAKIEERPATENSIENNQRNARNLNEESSEDLEEENEGMQNIEEEKEKTPNELLNESRNPTATSPSQVPDSTLYSHEANEITEDDIAAQKEINESIENIDQESHSIGSQENEQLEGEQKEQEVAVNPDSGSSTDANDLDVKQAQDNELSIALDENLNSTQENIEAQEKPAVGEEDKPIQLNDADVKSAEGDEASLSIVLDENLTATEPVGGLTNDQLEHLLKLNLSEPLLIEDVDTTLEPETVKSVHIVIKKQGVELDDDANQNETTTDADMEEETTKEDGYEIAETTAANAAKGESEEAELLHNAQNDDATNEEATTETVMTHVTENEAARDDDINEEPINNINEFFKNNDERSDQGEHSIVDTTDPTSNELDAKFEKDEQALPDETEYDMQLNKEHDKNAENSANTQEVEPVSDESTYSTPSQEEMEDSNQHSTTEEIAGTHISHASTTPTPAIGTTQAHDTQPTTLKEFEVYEDNTDDPDIVPILVGVNGGEGDLTASTKGSRSINTQTRHSMLLTQMDDRMAATLFKTFPPQNAGQMFNDHSAAESSGGRIGKPLPGVGISKTSTSASLLSGSGLIIVLCASIAFMFLLVSVVAFVISFQRQRGTLDIEMQEQRCGKDNLDEEDANEVGACTKLLEIELPKSAIAASSEELEECL